MKTRAQARLGGLDGGTVVLLLLLGALGYAIAGRLLDGMRVTYDALARPLVTTDGSLRTVVGLGLFVAGAGLASWLMLQRREYPRAGLFVLSIQGLLLWWCAMSLVVPRAPGSAPLLTLGAIPLVLAVVTVPPTRSSLRHLQLTLDLFGVANVLYSTVNPAIAQFPCRDDKCGVFGSMYSGFFLQENVAPGIVALFLPVAVASRSDSRALVSALIGASVALTSGSRTGLLSVFVAIVLVFTVRWLLRRRPAVSVPSIVLAAPLLVSVVGLFVFATVDDESLTGRGLVYRVIREALVGPSLLYGGDWSIVELGTDGYLSGEHGQVPHVIARAGVIGLVLWFAAMAALLRERVMGLEQLVGLAILLTASVGMITEPRLELDVRSVSFAALLLVTGLLSKPPEGDAPPTGRVPLSGRRAVPAAALMIAALALPAVMPRVYSAQAHVFVSSNARWPGELVSAYEVSRVKALTYRQLADEDSTLAAVSQRTGFDTPALLRKSLLDSRLDDRETILILRAEHTDEATAAALAEQWAGELVERSGELENRGVGTPPQAQVVALGDATVSQRNPWLAYGGLSLLLGLFSLVIVYAGRATAPDHHKGVNL